MIRVANKKDIIDIYNIGNQYKNNFQKTFNIENYLMNNNYIILVNVLEKVNAFIIVYKNIDFFELEMIIVDKEFREKGIASKLIEHFFSNYTKKDQIILLEVATDNLKAIRLYEKYGFEIINTRKKYYEGKIDAYVMKKVI